MPKYHHLLLLLGLLLGAKAACVQPKTPADFGYRHLRLRYKGDTVDVLVLSKKGEEQQRKPVFLYVQGSLPRPLIFYDEKGPYRTFPFTWKIDQYLTKYHFVVVGKPGVPPVAPISQLQPGTFAYLDPRTQLPPVAFCRRNYLEYYVARDAAVLRYLARQPWVQARDITAMGHSEGAPIVARLACTSPHLRRAIYLNGSSLGRILTMLPSSDLTGDTTGNAAAFGRWRQIVAAPRACDCTQPGDSPLTTASFSERRTPVVDFRRCRIPVFVGYGTRDPAAISNDYLRLEMLRAGKLNFTFRAYAGVEHNFFGFTDGKVDYEKEHWDEVTSDFFSWMQSH